MLFFPDGLLYSTAAVSRPPRETKTWETASAQTDLTRQGSTCRIFPNPEIFPFLLSWRDHRWERGVWNLWPSGKAIPSAPQFPCQFQTEHQLKLLNSLILLGRNYVSLTSETIIKKLFIYLGFTPLHRLLYKRLEKRLCDRVSLWPHFALLKLAQMEAPCSLSGCH